MKADKRLQVGDVFNVPKGFKVYSGIPEYFVYSNGIGFDLANTECSAGKPFKRNEDKYDTTYLIGEYVVTEARMEGGGTGHGPGDVYPDGWRIRAKQLKDGKWDDNGVDISFYQSGCFTIEHENVPVIRQMKKAFV